MRIDIETDRTILAGSISYDELLLVYIRLVLDNFVRLYFIGLYLVIYFKSIDLLFFLEPLPILLSYHIRVYIHKYV